MAEYNVKSSCRSNQKQPPGKHWVEKLEIQRESNERKQKLSGNTLNIENKCGQQTKYNILTKLFGVRL